MTSSGPNEKDTLPGTPADAFTLTGKDPDRPPLWAEIVVKPGPSAKSKPSALTLAAAVSEDCQVPGPGKPPSGFPEASVGVAVSWTKSPDCTTFVSMVMVSMVGMLTAGCEEPPQAPIAIATNKQYGMPTKERWYLEFIDFFHSS